MTMLRRLLPLALLVPLALSGCDTAEEGTDTFPLTSERPAGFVYMAGTLSAGSTFESDPETQLSQPIINDSRFGPSDVALARIREGSVELQLDFPAGAENEVLIDEATLTLSAPGVGDRVVARGSDFSLATVSTTAPRRQVLELVNADITEFLQQESFTGTLTLDVAGAGSQSYQFTATFDVDVEVTVEAANRAPVAF